MSDEIQVTIEEDSIAVGVTQNTVLVGGDIWVRRSGDTMTGNLAMSDNTISAVGSVAFALAASVESGEGIMTWNADDGTLEYGLPGGVVMLQIGQEQNFRAKNVSGDTLTNGTPIVISGTSGVRPEINLAATTPHATSGAIGMTTESIDNNQSGYVTTFGLVRGIDTSGISAGARAFLSDTPGEISPSLPAVANRKVFLGVVISSNVDEGIMLLSPINIFFLDELSGMDISNLQDGDGIFYRASTNTWINQQP